MEKHEATSTIVDYVEKNFTDTYLPALMKFVEIPNLSPMFDKEWNTNGLQMQACNHLKDFADSLEIEGYTSQVIKEDDRTPVLFLTIEPFKTEGDAKTVLFYAHMDKQPWGEGWDEDKIPNVPIVLNGKLYGRGGADDGYGMFSALLSIKSCQDNGLSHPRIYVMIEGSEESSEDDLIYYVEKLGNENIKHSPDLVIALDSETPAADTFCSTSSLRGIINFDLKVEAFKDNIHSGASGIFADTFTVATDLIRRLEDKETYLMKDEYQVDIPEYRIEEIKKESQRGIRSEQFKAGVEGIKSVPTLNTANDSDIAFQEYVNSTWKSVLSVIGARGLPDCDIAGNCLRKSTTLTISIRTPPTASTKEMLKKIREVLTTDVPFNYKVSLERVDVSDGWNSKALSEDIDSALKSSVKDVYGTEPAFIGCGGAIPFAEILGRKYPKANFLITGASLPDTNAHGPNENLDLISTKNLTATIGLMLSKI
jgi:acetylornithine deacetylase/succinyl-diaminopimelate desuccinylase-like protein